MKAFLKTLISGALGLGALYVVGKVCYEAGKEVAEVERQLELGKHEADEMGHSDQPEGDEGTSEEQHSDPIGVGTISLDESNRNIDRILRNAQDGMSKAVDEAWEKHTTRSRFGKLVDKVRNAKMFARIKKAFDKGDRSPGILGSLLSNPDGARIEAFVRNGGVQINVTPRAA